jgi:anti-anti-sigma factor
MQIERSETDSEIVYTVAGSLSGMPDSAPRFFNEISTQLPEIKKKLVFDFQKLLFIDSMAIGLLVGLLIKASQLKIKVHILNPRPLIHDILESSRLKKMFPDLY